MPIWGCAKSALIATGSTGHRDLPFGTWWGCALAVILPGYLGVLAMIPTIPRGIPHLGAHRTPSPRLLTATPMVLPMVARAFLVILDHIPPPRQATLTPSVIVDGLFVVRVVSPATIVCDGR